MSNDFVVARHGDFVLALEVRRRALRGGDVVENEVGSRDSRVNSCDKSTLAI